MDITKSVDLKNHDVSYTPKNDKDVTTTPKEKQVSLRVADHKNGNLENFEAYREKIVSEFGEVDLTNHDVSCTPEKEKDPIAVSKENHAPFWVTDRKDKNLGEFEAYRDEIIRELGLAKDLSHALGKLGIPTERLSKQIDSMSSELKQSDFRIGVIGRFRIGKSTLLNVLLGGRVLREEEIGGGCTAMVTRIVRGDEFSAKLIYFSADEMHDILINTLFKAGIIPQIHDSRSVNTRDFLFLEEFRCKSIELLNKRKEILTKEVSRRKPLIDFALHILTRWEEFEKDLGKQKAVSPKDFYILSGDRSLAPFIKEASLTVPFTGLPENVVLVDTPGLGAPNWDENFTVKCLADCHAAIHLLLPPAGFEAIDADLLTYLKQQQPHIFDKVIFCINRSDEVSTQCH